MASHSQGSTRSVTRTRQSPYLRVFGSSGYLLDPTSSSSWLTAVAQGYWAPRRRYHHHQPPGWPPKMPGVSCSWLLTKQAYNHANIAQELVKCGVLYYILHCKLACFDLTTVELYIFLRNSQNRRNRKASVFHSCQIWRLSIWQSRLQHSETKLMLFACR